MNALSEDFLQYVWKHKLYDPSKLKDQHGRKIEVISPGETNTDGGPDFFNMRLKIDGIVWAGNAEVHVLASDWYRHNHQADAAYNNVILHIVSSNDKEVQMPGGQILPAVELAFDENLLHKYERIISSKGWISCSDRISTIETFRVRAWLTTLLIERLNQKTDEVFKRLDHNKGSWEETFYQSLATGFGFKVNTVPFELLARSLPLRIVAKHKDNLFQLEALFFGQAGFLTMSGDQDAYTRKLCAEYQYLQHKYELKPLEGYLWKFLRLRPVNFPTIRIAQMAWLINHSSALFSKITDTSIVEDLKILLNTATSEYWDTHYRFGKLSSYQKKAMGEASVENLIINTLVPVLFACGKQKNQTSLTDRALQLLEGLPSEKNAVIKNWEAIGIRSKNAFDSQALLQLKKNYCSKKRCIHCSLGHLLLHEKE